MRSITIPVDEEVFFVLKKDTDSMQNDMRTILAMQYFRERRLGLGLAAKLAGMSKNDFAVFLGQNNIDIYQYAPSELQCELDMIDNMSVSTP